jgi:RNA polymerase sigma factor (sigma-70 family)
MDVLASKEDEDRLNAALQRLRPEEKEVFLLRQKVSPTYGEIARIRSIPIGSVKTLMHGAVQKLRCLLAEKSELLN